MEENRPIDGIMRPPESMGHTHGHLIEIVFFAVAALLFGALFLTIVQLSTVSSDSSDTNRSDEPIFVKEPGT